MLKKIRKFFFQLRSRKWRLSTGPGLNLECWLALQGPGKVTIGKNCIIAAMPGCRVGMVTLNTHSPEAEISIGNNVVLVSARFGAKFSISIGNNVIIEDASILDTDFHSLDPVRETPTDEIREKSRVVLEDRVQVGARSIITKGVTIGHDSIVLPGAVVHRSIPPYSTVIGNPGVLLSQKRGYPS